jgi:hypothetical protein
VVQITRMKRKSIPQPNLIEYSLTQNEAKLVEDCLDYCYHRLTKHGKTFADVHRVDQLRKEFKK